MRQMQRTQIRSSRGTLRFMDNPGAVLLVVDLCGGYEDMGEYAPVLAGCNWTGPFEIVSLVDRDPRTRTRYFSTLTVYPLLILTYFNKFI